MEPFEEFLLWYKILNRSKMESLLEELMPNPEHKLAYQLTVETNSTREIEQRLRVQGFSVSFQTISEWQKKWVQAGLVKQVSAHKRQRLLDLDDFNL